MNTKDDWVLTATFRDPERRELWSFVFPGARVPIKSSVRQPVNVPGYQNVDAYFLDLDAITDLQRDDLITVLSTRFNLSFEEVKKDIALGVPILAEGVSVSSTVGFSCITNDEDWELVDEESGEEE